MTEYALGMPVGTHRTDIDVESLCCNKYLKSDLMKCIADRAT
jgi:hypothetical protein